MFAGNYLRFFFPFFLHFIGAWDAHQFWVVFISWWIFNFSDWGYHSKKFSSMNKDQFLTYSCYQGPYLLWKMFLLNYTGNGFKLFRVSSTENENVQDPQKISTANTNWFFSIFATHKRKTTTEQGSYFVHNILISTMIFAQDILYCSGFFPVPLNACSKILNMSLLVWKRYHALVCPKFLILCTLTCNDVSILFLINFQHGILLLLLTGWCLRVGTGEREIVRYSWKCCLIIKI